MKLLFMLPLVLACSFAYGSGKDDKEKSENTVRPRSASNGSASSAAAAKALSTDSTLEVSGWTIFPKVSYCACVPHQPSRYFLGIKMPYATELECRDAYKRIEGTSEEKKLLRMFNNKKEKFFCDDDESETTQLWIFNSSERMVCEIDVDLKEKSEKEKKASSVRALSNSSLSAQVAAVGSLLGLKASSSQALSRLTIIIPPSSCTELVPTLQETESYEIDKENLLQSTYAVGKIPVIASAIFWKKEFPGSFSVHEYGCEPIDCSHPSCEPLGFCSASFFVILNATPYTEAECKEYLDEQKKCFRNWLSYGMNSVCSIWRRQSSGAYILDPVSINRASDRRPVSITYAGKRMPLDKILLRYMNLRTGQLIWKYDATKDVIKPKRRCCFP